MDNRLLMSSSSSSSSSDEENLQVRRRPRILNRRNPFIEYEDIDFKMRFRVSKTCVEEILNLIGNHLDPLSNRNKPVSAINQLLIALRFYATGSFQICTGDHFNVSKATVCRIIKKVSHHLALLRPIFINMPANRNEVAKIKNDFYSISGFPHVIGAVDCTHIRIQSPGGEDGEIFRNRKGWFSVNAQAVCDAKLRFLDIVARWPGSVHDSTIFNDCFLRARLENNEYPDSYLLGDSGYACKKYLLTPLLNPATRSENAYNFAQIQTRNVIERAFGVLKRRFPCLSLGMRVNMQTILATIVATTVLHNIAIQMNDNEPDIDPEIEVELNENPGNIQQNNGADNDNAGVRRALINTIFLRH